VPRNSNTGHAPLRLSKQPVCRRLARSIVCRTRLSPPTLHQHDDASTHHDKNDDGGKRFHRGQGLVPVVPKLKHAPTSIESARPALRKSQCVERTCLCEQTSASKNAMLRFVARVLIARQHDLCRTAWGRVVFRGTKSPPACARLGFQVIIPSPRKQRWARPSQHIFRRAVPCDEPTRHSE
jgi:hypothetical protein